MELTIFYSIIIVILLTSVWVYHKYELWIVKQAEDHRNFSQHPPLPEKEAYINSVDDFYE